jgi:hypothetical protein
MIIAKLGESRNLEIAMACFDPFSIGLLLIPADFFDSISSRFKIHRPSIVLGSIGSPSWMEKLTITHTRLYDNGIELMRIPWRQN